MSRTEPTKQTTMLKRRVGYGEYMDAQETEHMEVDKHVANRQKIDWQLFVLQTPSIFFLPSDNTHGPQHRPLSSFSVRCIFVFISSLCKFRVFKFLIPNSFLPSENTHGRPLSSFNLFDII